MNRVREVDMLIDMECRNCRSDLEVDTDEILGDGSAIKCPNCRNRLTPKASEQLASALDDLLSQLLLIRKKFGFSFTVDSDDVALFEEAGEERSEDWEEDEELEDDDKDDKE